MEAPLAAETVCRPGRRSRPPRASPTAHAPPPARLRPEPGTRPECPEKCDLHPDPAPGRRELPGELHTGTAREPYCKSVIRKVQFFIFT